MLTYTISIVYADCAANLVPLRAVNPMRCALIFLCVVLLLLCRASSVEAQALELLKGDHISVIGNTTADRLQHHGWLETYIHALHPEHDLTFRNLAFAGDELKLRPREDNFGSPDQWLTKNESDVVFAFFGYNEALRGPEAIDGFIKDLGETIDGMLQQQYNGESSPRLVMFSPIAHENLKSRHLPDGSKNNVNLRLYTAAMQQVCTQKNVLFVDLFKVSRDLYAKADTPLTMNGIHLLDHGNKALAAAVVPQLFGGDAQGGSVGKLREAVIDKNYYWFSRYRVVDGYNVFGGRSKLAWFGQSNADVMRREMEIFDVMTENRDRRVWAVARGRDLVLKDDNIPEQLTVQSNRGGDKEDGSFSYRTADAGLELMKLAEGLEANVFASEEMFPEMVNPVQMAVDPDGRLFASVWPSYPHWNPTEPRHDRIVCLPDDNGDGVADRCVIFADGLNSVTSFEFWGGGMLVASLPELWFLKDTDGDDKADVKIRMLQGMSSADSHHSANAMVLGPDGWVYWSRGIFNVATMETPTQTYRSTRTGVHRFNPRTFEMEFHFPIGPNPHGDVFDKWGFQFANDGTSGTGSYVNIGKGNGNKQWFKKRVRPVAATGILSSSHFPDQFQNNFLICNCIGFLGVLQHEIRYNGADITAEEVEPIVVSSDPNFRPTDVEVGSDGALYVADWAQALIGHMQHNMRDPNRDHQHGRIYRITAANQPLLKPVKLKGKPIAEICEAFYAKENSTRYRARIELSGRDSDEVQAALAKWTTERDVRDPDDAQALLECLWVHEEHRLPNTKLLVTLMKAEEPRVRAAAVRTLGHWGDSVDNWDKILVAAAQDDESIVRAEAMKAAVEFAGATAAEAIFEAASRTSDPELETVLRYARGKINVDAVLAEAVESGRQLSPAAEAYALKQASPALLLKLKRNDAVYQALLVRSGIQPNYRREAIAALAKKNNRSDVVELVSWLTKAEKDEYSSLGDLAQLLATVKDDQLTGTAPEFARLASTTGTSSIRRAAYSAWIRAGGANEAWDHAVKTRATMTDLFQALQPIRKSRGAAPLFVRVRTMMFELPEHLQTGKTLTSDAGPAVAYEYYEPHPAQNVEVETLDAAKPKLTGKFDSFRPFVPKGKKDAFATRQTAAIEVPATGEYSFFTSSDDGSRLYIDEQLIVNNDGLHGMVEKSGTMNLEAGLHAIVVTYFDNGGGDGLAVSWSGPGFAKQQIPPSALRPPGSGNLRAFAIETIAGWPGPLNQKIDDFSKIAASKELTGVSLKALASLPSRRVADRLTETASDDVLQALIDQADKATPVQRQSEDYTKLLGLGNNLLAKASSRTASAKKLSDLRTTIPLKADPKIMAMGREVFSRESHCATCHQLHGQGLPNLYPPLDGSLWSTGSEDRLISLVLDGMHGTVEVKGRLYSSPPLPPMTGFRHLLNDEEIAAALTFVRNSWSNRAKPVSAAAVAKIRAIDRSNAAFWYANDLMEKFPLEDGREPIVESGERWVPQFVKKWTFEDLQPAKVTANPRSFATGQLFFTRLGCIQCHKQNNKGGSFGPDLTKLDDKKRVAGHVLISIVHPSKDVEQKFKVRLIFTNDGEVITGFVVADKPDELHLITDPLNSTMPTIVKKDNIDEEGESKTSIMPEGLVNWLTEEQIYDLAAFVLAGGNPKSELYP